MAATGELPVRNVVADVVADRDAMLRGVAHHTVIEFAATAQPRRSREARDRADGRNRTDRRRSRCPLTAQRRGVLMSVRGTRIPPHLQLPIAGVTPPPTEKEGQRLFPTGNFRFYRPVYRDKTPPCNNACPTDEQIQKYLDFVKHERFLDGYLTILEDNPMPSITGRVLLPPVRDRLQPRRTRRADRDPQRGAVLGRLWARPA